MKRIHLGSYPTPVERLDAFSGDAAALWIKRDDLTCARYGGNKVRKLELLLSAARDAGKTRILTVGAVGSHQVVATALFGSELGFEVEALLVAQPRTPHAEENVRAALAHGLRATPVPAWALVPAFVLARRGRDTYYVPLGASNPLGSLGFVDAARELGAQIQGGALPEPDVVVVALGSGGTAAGLAVGFEELGLRTRVVGVAVSHPAPVLGIVARRLARRTALLAGLGPRLGARAAARITVESEWVGRGYGHSSPAAEAATADGAAAGVVLDETYTAKAFASALAHARAGSERTVLYWHTLSAAHLAPGAEPLPRALERLLQ